MPINSNAQVHSIHVYPIKSCAGTTLEHAICLDSGLLNDRRWVITDEGYTAITQRDTERMVLITPTPTDDERVRLTAPEMEPLEFPILKSESSMTIDIWGNTCKAMDAGDEAARWISSFLGRKCRLVQAANDTERRTKVAKPNGQASPVLFNDSSPLLVISQESLDDLNARLDEPVPMDRFRPSIVIKGLGAYAEESIPELKVGGLTLHSAKPCTRCVIVTIDQETALKRGPEPLKTLALYKKLNEKVVFGQYFLPETSGSIAVGDLVRS